MPDELESALILQCLPGLGAAGITGLRRHCGSFSGVLELDVAELPPRYRQALRHYQQSPLKHRDLARQVIDLCADTGTSIIAIDDADYPALLGEIDSPPPLLYVRGDPHLLSMPQIAMVGSRQHSAAGAQNARAFARSLGASGFVITSGLALGIDAAAHRGALGTGRTIAVLGTGIDLVYPRRHENLYQQILDGGGAIVTELPPGTPARAGHFPQRNRIISGLSLGVLVVEAAIRSGSLITARMALEQSREVFAIPGSIHNPLAKGCHRLIREGATLVETAQDIAEQLGGMLGLVEERSLQARTGKADSTVSLSSSEEKVLGDLGFDPTDLDSLAVRTRLGAGELTAILVRLELLGLVENRDGIYCRLA